MSHDEERVSKHRIQDKHDRAPRHWLNPLGWAGRLSSEGPVGVKVDAAGRANRELAGPPTLKDGPVFLHPFAALRTVWRGCVDKHEREWKEDEGHHAQTANHHSRKTKKATTKRQKEDGCHRDKPYLGAPTLPPHCRRDDSLRCRLVAEVGFWIRRYCVKVHARHAAQRQASAAGASRH